MTIEHVEQGHVLVVDDNQVIRMVLTRALQGQGHMVAIAEDGRQALDILRAAPGPGRIDVILLDIVMPEMDGYATLAALQQDPALRSIPVIVISSLDEMDAVSRCIELGASDYIPKPFNAALLRALQGRISASVGASRLRLLQRDYQEHAGRIAAAAGALEAGAFDPASLDATAARPDALGRAAQALQRLASLARSDRAGADAMPGSHPPAHQTG